MIIKHRNMRDVCAQVLLETDDGESLVLKVIWINLLGTFDHPAPFVMGSSSRPAVQDLRIPKKNFSEDWVQYPKLSEVAK